MGFFSRFLSKKRNPAKDFPENPAEPSPEGYALGEGQTDHGVDLGQDENPGPYQADSFPESPDTALKLEPIFPEADGGHSGPELGLPDRSDNQEASSLAQAFPEIEERALRPILEEILEEEILGKIGAGSDPSGQGPEGVGQALGKVKESSPNHLPNLFDTDPGQSHGPEEALAKEWPGHGQAREDFLKDGPPKDSAPDKEFPENSKESIENQLLSELDSFFRPQADEIPDNSGLSWTQASLEGEIGPVPDMADRPAEGPTALDAHKLWPTPPEPESELGQIRNLLFERELSQLSLFSEVVKEPSLQAHILSRVITEAILLRTRRDDKLNTVLGPTVDKIVTASVRRNPEALATQIFPVIGPAIRRSISETFRSMLQNFNSTLEMSFSLKGLKWRLEAMRVKKPFSEIVLLHTLLYQVEEIYLIHAESGRVLDHMVAQGMESRDADMVAGMFTAIRDFVRDSFSVGQKENLDNLTFGDRTISLLRSDQIFMACVVRGNPPANLNQDLQEALELMSVDCAADLEAFTGETEPFLKYRPFFTDFLEARYQEKPSKLPLMVRLAPAMGLILLLIAAGTFYLSARQQRTHDIIERSQAEKRLLAAQNSQKSWQTHVNSIIGLLSQEPGILVGLVTQNKNGIFEISLLKDELASDPAEILESQGGLAPSLFRLIVKPFVSLDPSIIKKRLVRTLDPPPGVAISLDEESGLLTLSGQASQGWIMSARERALTVPGVKKVDFSGLADPRSFLMKALIADIDGVVIHFPSNKDQPIPEDKAKLEEAVDKLVALEKLAQEMELTVNLVIYGHADAVGQDRHNYELSEERTKTVAALLYARGSSMPISNYGLGSTFSAQSEDGAPPKEDQESRRIELKVRLGSMGQASPILGGESRPVGPH
jgi:OOP family OmpA-OmpF porin